MEYVKETDVSFDYGLDDKVPFLKSLLFGFQWAAIIVSSVIILGKVVGALHFSEPLSQVVYLQKILCVCGITLFCQVYLGHRLPIVPGPAAVLLIGILASQDSGTPAIYASMTVGGILLASLAISGFFGYLQRFFTPNVVAVVLLLIAFTIAPTIQNLMVDPKSGIDPLYNMGFAVMLLFLMLLCYRLLRGIWRSTLIIWAMIAGSLFYFLIFPDAKTDDLISTAPWFSDFFQKMNLCIVIRPGVLISFIFCYLALSINDLGSIQSVSEVLRTGDTSRRVTGGIFVTGLANIASGLFGVIGPVNYSVSPGLIVSTGCASRFTLVPAAFILLILAFFPAITGCIGSVPPVVIAAVLTYVMTSQIAAGLMVAFRDAQGRGFVFENGMVIGLAVLLGVMVAFLPGAVIQKWPAFLRPILGNGFVAGVASALILERLFIRAKGPETPVPKKGV